MDSSELQFQSAGNPLVSLTPVNTLPGVQILSVAALNGPGNGLLDCDAVGNLTWAPPGGAAGTPVDCSAGGTFLLPDATGNAWLSVYVVAEYLALASQAAITLQDVYDGPLVNSDVTAAQASGGNVSTWTLSLVNTSSSSLSSVALWFTAGGLASGLGLQASLDGSTWTAPTSGSPLAVGTMAASASVTVHLKRTIPAAEASAAAVAVELAAGWTVSSTNYQTAARGLYRIFNAAKYRVYCESTPPVQGSTPTWTVNSLPTTGGSFADGTWYLAVSYFDGVYDSGFLSTETIVVSGGSAAPALPGPVLSVDLAETSPGTVTVTATATGTAGFSWFVDWTASNHYVTCRGGALDVLSYDITGLSPGATITVDVSLYNFALSAGGPALSASITLGDSSGPSAPLAAIAAEPIQQ
jgi:hypothetical protein